MKRIGDILLEKGLVSQADLDRGLKRHEAESLPIGEALVKMKVISSAAFTRALAEHTHLPFIDLKAISPENRLMKSFPEEMALEFRAVPVKYEGESLLVALSDPTNLSALDSIRFFLKQPVLFGVGDPLIIQRLLSKYYSGDGFGAPEEDVSTDAFEDDDDTTVHLVNDLLIQAVSGGASDIHIEPLGRALRIRYRLDGHCYEQDNLPLSNQVSIISRIKLISGMDISENRLPQDGRIELKISNELVDFRVSSIPTKHGESIVLRILDKEGMATEIEALGLLEEDAVRFKRLIKEPDGILLVTGPTGSGKTTTLYTALQSTQSREIKIITTEDPVEYSLDGITQIQVNAKIGLTFSRALRHILRHDPDVILVGEIRDIETAEIAMRSAMTGHKVYSTLHTNDAPSAINRLINIGVEPFLITASLRTIIAQRLVRQLCLRCRAPGPLKDHQKKIMGIEEDREIYEPIGCQYCGQTGYRGRTAIFEIMTFNETIKELTLSHASSLELRQAALASGMRSLRSNGFEKVLMGITSIAEVLAVT